MNFTFARTPSIVFGPGKFIDLEDMIGTKGKTVLIVTGSKSFESSGRKDSLNLALRNKSVSSHFLSVESEPSPEFVDTSVSQFRNSGIDVVCSIGGGSVIDAGKAISAMLLQDGSVIDYLEGVGTGKIYNGKKIPFIAVPTTAGTGSEATKNAVLSRIGPDGFKKSLRHENLVPDYALIDPELMLSCPPDVTAATGMDAFTQLLESYVSTKAIPITDALAYSGLCSSANNLVPACTTGAGNIDVRSGMAYAALLSGITLANAGLGIVHGLASAIGGMVGIPHGVVCGTIMGAAVEVTIEALQKLGAPGTLALHKYALIGALFAEDGTKNTPELCGPLVDKLDEWTDILSIPKLGEFGITTSDIDTIIAGTGNKNNPVKLEAEEIRRIIEMRL